MWVCSQIQYIHATRSIEGQDNSRGNSIKGIMEQLHVAGPASKFHRVLISTRSIFHQAETGLKRLNGCSLGRGSLTDVDLVSATLSGWHMGRGDPTGMLVPDCLGP